jgi:predicted nuclease of restriction endonuclease-like (RecB) superfamily
MPGKRTKARRRERKPARRKTPKGAGKGRLSFAALVEAVQQVHERSTAAAKRAVNTSLTLRNWLIGWYIIEYELRGADRATYGEGLLRNLAERLDTVGVPNCNASRLYRYRDFCRLYPDVGQVTARWLSPLLPSTEVGEATVASTPPQSPAPKVATVSPQSRLDAATLVERLSYSHIELLLELDDPLKRAFYEVECIRGRWSVRALKRQIASLYFERSGLSTDKEKLAAMAHAVAEQEPSEPTIRDPYVFEFLGLKPKEAVAEGDLETALLDHLQDFLLELGHGFCFEARQRSIVIGNTRGSVDLVFYHRVLKCHVLIELKVDEFRHEHLGQLNTYVTWYSRHVMAEGDNPPIGLLLCTRKDHALVEYAMAAIDSRLFVSKYQLELPRKEDLQRFLEDKRREMGDDE